MPQNEQDALRLGLALGENHRDAAAYEVFRSAMNQFEWDERMLYFAGIAAYNSGQYGRAFRHFGELSKWEWENSISLYYRNLAQEAMKEEPQVLWLAYEYQVPVTEAARRVSVINGVLRQGPGLPEAPFGARSFAPMFCGVWSFPISGCGALVLRSFPWWLPKSAF